MNVPDSTLLCDFATDCHLPETVQIVDGYESLESEELSWSKDEIANLHNLTLLTRVIARDVKENYFSIPLTFQGKIFESIPVGCRDRYETVEELIVAFPRYVRSLRDIPQSGVADGDILLLLEASPNGVGCRELRCKVVGKSCTISLPGNQFGPFETLDNAYPTSIQDAIDGHHLPSCVRVRAGVAQALDETNTRPRVKFEGLFFLEQKVQQKVFIVSTLNERQLRVLKLPIDLEITVRREKSNIDPQTFSHICHLIETEVDIDSTITCGSTGDASWYFDIAEESPKPANYFNEYEELRPLIPPRSPTKPDRPLLKENRISNKPDVVARYAPPPKPKPRKKPPVPVIEKRTVEEPVRPPPVSRKPTKTRLKQPGKEQPPRSGPSIALKRDNSAKCPQNRESHIGPEILEADCENYSKPVEMIDKVSVAQSGEKASMCAQKEKVFVLPKIYKDEDNDEDNIYESIDEELRKQSRYSEPSGSEDAVLPDRYPPAHSGTLSHDQQIAQQEVVTVDESRKRLEGMSVSKVSEWLRKLGMSQYVDLFVEESVDGTMLLELDDEMMQCIGIKNPLHRKKLSMFIHRGWTPKR